MDARELRAHQPALGEVLQLRRGHPCGSDRFVVTHVALDVRLSCTGCGARLILSRAKLQSRLRAVDENPHLRADNDFLLSGDS
jgi:hypothetical protein